MSIYPESLPRPHPLLQLPTNQRSLAQKSCVHGIQHDGGGQWQDGYECYKLYLWGQRKLLPGHPARALVAAKRVIRLFGRTIAWRGAHTAYRRTDGARGGEGAALLRSYDHTNGMILMYRSNIVWCSLEPHTL